MLEKFKEAAQYIKDQYNEPIEWGIVLGSGLGVLADEIEVITTLPYKNIPHFPQTTVHGHRGELIIGKLEGKVVLMVSGRFHYYEGYDMSQVTFPIRVMGLLGIKNLVVSNASGGVNPNFKVGDVMLIKDHINKMPNPLRGVNLDELGPRFVDMHEPYDQGFISLVEKIAAKKNIPIQKGIYLSLEGPTFETPAEYGMVRVLGGDAVGMSTVPEVIVAKHQGMKVFGISVITDLGGPDIAFPVSHEEVLGAAKVATPKVVELVRGLIVSA